MDEPEDNRIHVHRDGVFRQCFLCTEGRGLNALVDDGHDIVDNRNDEEEARPLTPRRLPARRMTNFSQVFAILRAAAMPIAPIAKWMPQ